MQVIDNALEEELKKTYSTLGRRLTEVPAEFV